MKFTAVIAFFYALFAAAFIATAVPTNPTVTVTVTAPGSTPTSVGQCTSQGGAQCCQQVQAAQSGGLVGVILGLLGIVLSDVTALVGLDCVSIVGGGACSAQTVCCQNNGIGFGLINISLGCVVL